ncbi:zinc finger protein 3-like isoform X5 [Esox lucius]|uniref:zinc finger protein 3-like isoform X5 n=1 Tax=Esox lucius TaxID=8010 RepID=UPI00147684A6|nr:zinc finger protein 3-like isoform X5 [Esox lucius]
MQNSHGQSSSGVPEKVTWKTNDSIFQDKTELCRDQQMEDKPSLLLSFHTEPKQESLDSDCDSKAQCSLVDSEVTSVNLEGCIPPLGPNEIKYEEVEEKIGIIMNKEETFGDLTNHDEIPEVEIFLTFGEQNQEDCKVCPHCKKHFLSLSKLKRHINTHTGEKPYSCSDCGKSFIRSSDLTNHRRVHTGEKPYSCSDCGKCFIRSSDLTNHRRVHTGEKPYSCSDCGKCYFRSCHLSGHRRVHTGEKPYSCSDCGKCFIRSSDLTNHRRVHTAHSNWRETILLFCLWEMFQWIIRSY